MAHIASSPFNDEKQQDTADELSPIPDEASIRRCDYSATFFRKDVCVEMAFACRDQHNADCGISRSSNDKRETTILAAAVATTECYLHPGRGYGVG